VAKAETSSGRVRPNHVLSANVLLFSKSCCLRKITYELNCYTAIEFFVEISRKNFSVSFSNFTKNLCSSMHHLRCLSSFSFRFLTCFYFLFVKGHRLKAFATLIVLLTKGNTKLSILKEFPFVIRSNTVNSRPKDNSLYFYTMHYVMCSGQGHYSVVSLHTLALSPF
jgi:hypothetical protein